jgi:predicted O-methyltransferase YrrM|tara:strand:- start:79 stop:645 length:567 start_codon:yes stop_codon:yes gene_type:complete
MMDHFYKNIYGFCDYTPLYRDVAERFPSGSHFVEVGGFLGKSAAYMAVEIINSGKHIKFDVVDHWQGSAEHATADEINLETLYEDFLKNVEPVKGIINPIRMNSQEASKLYKLNSLDFIFIDADHDEEAVKADLISWMPRLKEDGVIAGDDINNPGVANAVKWFFDTEKLEIVGAPHQGRQWMIDLSR